VQLLTNRSQSTEMPSTRVHRPEKARLVLLAGSSVEETSPSNQLMFYLQLQFYLHAART
jgi:hypothetical protein